MALELPVKYVAGPDIPPLIASTEWIMPFKAEILLHSLQLWWHTLIQHMKTNSG